MKLIEREKWVVVPLCVYAAVVTVGFSRGGRRLMFVFVLKNKTSNIGK